MSLEFGVTKSTFKKGNAVRIMRVPSHGIPSACIIDNQPTQHGVHWFHGRTVPHFDDRHCPYCDEADCLRREWYLAIWIPDWSWVRIVAITDFAMQPVLRHQERHGRLRGTECSFSRTNNEAKGRLTINVKGEHPQAMHQPDEIRTKLHLQAVWEQNESFVNHHLNKDLAGQFLRKMQP